MQAWAEVTTALNNLQHLRVLAIAVTVIPVGVFARPMVPYTEDQHTDILRAICQQAPAFLHAVDLKICISTSSVLTAHETFFSVDWRAVGRYLSDHSTLEVLRVRLITNEGGVPLWRESWVRIVCESFPSLPIRVGESDGHEEENQHADDRFEQVSGTRPFYTLSNSTVIYVRLL